MKRSSRKQRRHSRDYQDKRRQGQAKENQVSDSERLTRSEPAPVQGLRLPSAKSGQTYLVEAPDGTLVDVPAEKLDEWSRTQGQGAEQQLTEKEGELLEKVLEMLYGKEE